MCGIERTLCQESARLSQVINSFYSLPEWDPSIAR